MIHIVTMHPVKLSAYYHLIRVCQSTTLYNGDCIVFVEENDEGLQVVPMSLTNDSLTGEYYATLKSVFETSGLREAIHIQRIYSSLQEEWERQLESDEFEEGLHVLRYSNGEVIMSSPEGRVSFWDNQ
jgi:hypothetical protein